MEVMTKMDIKQQVCSLELAMKLKELGVKQESLYFWQTNEDGDVELSRTGFTGQGIRQYEAYSAFTVAELGEMLPLIKQKYNITYCVRACKVTRHIWNIAYHGGSDDRILGNHVLSAETEVDARAKMLIWLIENGYIFGNDDSP